MLLPLEERGQILREFELGLITTSIACQQLSVTRPTLYRQLKKYQSGGLQALRHGNTGQVPANKLSDEVGKRIEELLLERYSDLQPALARKYLKMEEGIEVSEEYIRRRLVAHGKQAQKKAQRLHQSRRRRSRFGELIQIDGSPHHWFGIENPPCCLLVFVDDATGKITAAKFVPTETSAGYLELIREHVLKYGIPVSFYSDKHSIFTYNNERHKKGTKTQYQRCCGALGIEIILASTPQAKGRVERLNRSLQGRWLKEFQLLNIRNMEDANAHLPEFIAQYNEEFALMPWEPEDAHVQLSSDKERDAVKRFCALWYERKLSKSLSCNFDNSVIQVQGIENKWSLAGKYINVIEYPDDSLEVVHGSKLLPFIRRYRDSLKCFEQYEETTKTIDHRLDQIMEKEKNRRAAWLEKRRTKAKKAMDTKEMVLKAAEELAKEK